MSAPPAGKTFIRFIRPLTEYCSYYRRSLDAVSEAARALFFGLLQLYLMQRLTASQSMQHPFITQLSYAKGKVTPRKNSTLETLRRTVTVIRGYHWSKCIASLAHRVPPPCTCWRVTLLQRVLRCFGQDTVGPLRLQLSAGSQQRLQVRAVRASIMPARCDIEQAGNHEG